VLNGIVAAAAGAAATTLDQRAVATQDDTRAANYRAMLVPAAFMLWSPA
jgi:hypothetical protein